MNQYSDRNSEHEHTFKRKQKKNQNHSGDPPIIFSQIRPDHATIGLSPTLPRTPLSLSLSLSLSLFNKENLLPFNTGTEIHTSTRKWRSQAVANPRRPRSPNCSLSKFEAMARPCPPREELLAADRRRAPGARSSGAMGSFSRCAQCE